MALTDQEILQCYRDMAQQKTPTFDDSAWWCHVVRVMAERESERVRRASVRSAMELPPDDEPQGGSKTPRD